MNVKINDIKKIEEQLENKGNYIEEIEKKHLKDVTFNDTFFEILLTGDLKDIEYFKEFIKNKIEIENDDVNIEINEDSVESECYEEYLSRKQSYINEDDEIEEDNYIHYFAEITNFKIKDNYYLFGISNSYNLKEVLDKI